MCYIHRPTAVVSSSEVKKGFLGRPSNGTAQRMKPGPIFGEILLHTGSAWVKNIQLTEIFTYKQTAILYSLLHKELG